MRSKSIEIVKVEIIEKALLGLVLKYFYYETLSQFELSANSNTELKGEAIAKHSFLSFTVGF